MPRPRVEINPIRGLRVKQLCKEQGITQTELSNRIYISQQKISEMINGKANVTESTAQILSEKFPEYPFEWLMGYSDFRTHDEIRLWAHSLAAAVHKRDEDLVQAVIAMAESRGYHIQRFSGQIGGNDGTIILDESQLAELTKEIGDYLILRLKWLCQSDLSLQFPSFYNPETIITKGE